eukprot:TRINITY_DN931_c0_g1_i1.p2 TRINITY_DN931_c0_g1~~TRINITY_DN931_c0_g1_i1.p2  ORF type:complete len:106 (+),score=14.72 TRINITY_DN931_c0_g1_i1:447-764(+)
MTASIFSLSFHCNCLWESSVPYSSGGISFAWWRQPAVVCRCRDRLPVYDSMIDFHHQTEEVVLLLLLLLSQITSFASQQGGAPPHVGFLSKTSLPVAETNTHNGI